MRLPRISLRDVPGWLLLGFLIEAPWLYGSTRDWTLTVFNFLGSLVLVSWGINAAFQRKWPQVQPALLAAVAFLLAQGWLLIGNAQNFYDRTKFEFVPKASFWPGGPGALDVADAIPAMVRTTILLGLICFTCDLARSSRWRWRISWTVVLSAGSLALFGIIREALGILLISDQPDVGGSPFATYFYHANAAAYLNLAIPLAGALVATAFSAGGTRALRAVALPAFLLCLSGAAAAASKAGLAITVGLVLLLGVAEFRRRTRDGEVSFARAGTMVVGGLAILALATNAAWNAVSMQLEHVPGVIAEGTAEGRLLVAQVCLRMLPDAGAWGFGPGNFAITFPHYTGFLGNRVEGIWTFAHNDYLQTAVEWGWVGAIVWSALLFGGIAVGLRAYLSRRAELPRSDYTFLLCLIFALVGVAIHAAIDFPLQIASIQLYVAVYLGLLFAAPNWRLMTRQIVESPDYDPRSAGR